MEKIPRIIHYCWFGGNPKPELALKCIESWRKNCPDYKIIEWNENNFDINYNDYVREAYESKKWAFVTDVVRLYALTQYGGVYMDTDVEVLRPLDSLLEYQAVSGFETDIDIPTGLMACEKGYEMFVELLSEYDHIHFIMEDGSLDLTTNVVKITNTCEKYGFDRGKPNTQQEIRGFVLLPKEYLCPKDYKTGELNLTENTLTIHWFAGSWMPESQRYVMQRKQRLIRKHPGKLGEILAFIFEYTYVTWEAFSSGGVTEVINGIKREIKRRNV